LTTNDIEVSLESSKYKTRHAIQ